MIVNSGFRGASRIGTPPNMRKLRISGFGAVFGEDVPSSGWYDTSAGPSYNPDQMSTSGSSYSTTDWGATASGIGSGVGSILTGISTFFTRPSTGGGGNQYGNPQYQPQQSGGMSTGMMVGLAVLGVGAVLLLKK